MLRLIRTQSQNHTIMPKKTTKKAANKKVTKKTTKKAVKKAPSKKAANKTTRKPAKKIVKKAAKKTTNKRVVTHEDINYAAFLNFKNRIENGLDGDEQDDWIAAEIELKTS
jgi:hypothetical protein